jgi:nucleotide-binding universal stress UspA family protein
MFQTPKILVPTDFSAPSRKALAHGQALARVFGGYLYVLHSIEEVIAQGWSGYAFPAVLPPLRAEATAEARRRLEEAVPECERQDPPTEFVIRHGEPVEQIVRFAEERGVDVIVMGTHGRGGVAHLLLGSVAERVVREAPCAVLTVREKEVAPVAIGRTA